MPPAIAFSLDRNCIIKELDMNEAVRIREAKQPEQTP